MTCSSCGKVLRLGEDHYDYHDNRYMCPMEPDEKIIQITACGGDQINNPKIFALTNRGRVFHRAANKPHDDWDVLPSINKEEED